MISGDGASEQIFATQVIDARRPTSQGFTLRQPAYYPYNAPYGDFGGSFFDAPETSLQTSEWGYSYTATVYLMWDAATPYGCVPFTSDQSEQCSSIPVPLGHLSWGACGDAVNTLSSQTGQGGTNWTLNCPALETGPSAFVTDSTYPSWQGTIHQGDTLNFVQP
jgi:hypothetical protein